MPYPDDLDLNYEPTALPQPVGGYYWVVFTSRRKYGNTIVTPSQDDAPRKKLWVAALEVSAGELSGAQRARDISYPAFYLSEQELEAGNMRGFWSLEACKQLEAECRPGKDDCCNGGFCRLDLNSGKNKCVGTKTDCSLENETCSSGGDCCDGMACVNGHCLLSAPR
jgi:hypothetical protein